MNLKNSLKKILSKRVFLPLTLLTTTLLTSISCIPTISTNPQSTFDTYGPVAESQLVLFYWILGAAIFVFEKIGTTIRFFWKIIYFNFSNRK